MPGLIAAGAAKMASSSQAGYDEGDEEYALGCDATEQLIDDLMNLEADDSEGSDSENNNDAYNYYGEDSDDDGIVLEKYAHNRQKR